MPFDFVILTYDEAVILRDFIKVKTAVAKGAKPDAKEGVTALYGKLREFCIMSDHYQNDLHSLNPNHFVTHDEIR